MVNLFSDIFIVIIHFIPGDGPQKNGKGNFILLDGETFKPKGTYCATDKDIAPFGLVLLSLT